MYFKIFYYWEPANAKCCSRAQEYSGNAAVREPPPQQDQENGLDLKPGGDGAFRRDKPGAGAREGRRERRPATCLGSSDAGHHPAAVGRHCKHLCLNLLICKMGLTVSLRGPSELTGKRWK